MIIIYVFFFPCLFLKKADMIFNLFKNLSTLLLIRKLVFENKIRFAGLSFKKRKKSEKKVPIFKNVNNTGSHTVFKMTLVVSF